MKPFLLSLVVLGFLTTGAVAADAVTWAKSLEEAMEQAKDRGSMILICQTIDNEASNEAQREVFKDPAFVKASRDFLCIFACPETSHGEAPVTVDGQQVKRCAVAQNIVCRDHLKAWNDVRQNYAEYNTDSSGSTRIPFNLVIDGGGKVIATIVVGDKEGGFEVVPAAQFVAALKALVSQFGKGLTAEEYEAMKTKVAAAKKELEAGNYKAALKFASEALALNDRTKLAEEARSIRDTVAVQGRAEIAVAVQSASKDPVGAVVALEQIQEDYAGTIVADEAKTELTTLKRKPEIRKAMAEVAARMKAEKALARAEDAIAGKDYLKALQILDGVAGEFAGTSVGDRARARAEQLRGDAEIAALVKQQEADKYCKGWLSLGRSFVKNGMPDKAREKFQEVIDKFPGTSYADEAAEELKKLR